MSTTPAYEHVQVWEDGPVTVVSLNRPDKGNAISRRMAEEVQRAMLAFDAAPVLRNGRVRVASEDYLDAAGASFVTRTSTTAWLRLSESIDLHDVDPAQVRVPTLVVAVEGDRLVPLSDAVTLVEGIGLHGQLRVLRSAYGHDAFLKEPDRIDALLATVLDRASAGESA